MHLQDAPDLIEKVLNSEQDLSTKRNAFLMLCNHAQDRAVHYLLSQVDNVAHWGDILQMAVLELIRKVCLDSCNPDKEDTNLPHSMSAMCLHSTTAPDAFSFTHECSICLFHSGCHPPLSPPS